MTPQRWDVVRDVLYRVLELAPEQRPAFLEQACSRDDALRREVESFIGSAEQAGFEVLQSSAVDARLPKGTRLGDYEVQSLLGAGGMGEVYRARDTRLEREVAIKILPEGFASNPDRIARFQREAKVLASLNHPNIGQIYDVEERALVMELIEGPTLADRIREGPLRLEEALAIARQVAGALEAAHEKGIVHRDLKPSNIKVRSDSTVKLLDFGLAKATERPSTGSRDSNSATPITSGVILGTAAYMSPEQVRGAVVDKRADIWAFGGVLYEMLVGKRAFSGETTSDILAAVLKEELDWNALPAQVRPIVQKCLRRDPGRRWQDIGDVRIALEELQEGSDSGTLTSLTAPAAESRRRPSAWLIGTGVTLLLLLVGAELWFLNRDRALPGGTIFAQITDDSGAELFPSLSPDGKTVAYASKATGNWHIYTRRTGSSESTDLTGGSPDDDTQPSFSPDGRRIAFRSARDGGGIFVMSANGTGVRHLSRDGYYPAWSPDGTQIAYSEEGIARPEDRTTGLSRLWVIDVASGRKRLVTKGDAVQPQWSPNGRYLVYWANDLDADRDIWTIPADGGQPVRITRDSWLDWNPVWSPDGAYIYFCSNRGGSMGIWRIPMKKNSGEPRGAPEPIHTPAQYTAHLSFSRDGHRLAYSHLVTTGSMYSVRFDPGRGVPLNEPKPIRRNLNGIARPALSPDGKRLAFNSTEEEQNLFVMNADGSKVTQLTTNHLNRGPRWSPDGKQIAFFSDRSGDMEIWTIDVDTGYTRQITYLGGQNVAWPVWSPDGKYLAYTVFGGDTFIIEAGKPWAAQKPHPLQPYPKKGQIFNAWSWSPDGQMLAGFLNQDQAIAIYYLESGQFRTLAASGSDPVWLSDGHTLLFHHKGRIYETSIDPEEDREVISVAPQEIARRGFAVSPDDRQVYFSVTSTEADVWMLQFGRSSIGKKFREILIEDRADETIGALPPR